jgi:2-polyprenyl-6-methoxyphenol hydroxylase-like FAD-dependent oxidoreductase
LSAKHARNSPPWRDAILDCIDRRAVIGTPIAEYVPDKLVKGRVALVGDAAHVPTPMTGSGFSASLHDAETLAAAIAAHAPGPC